MLADTYCTTNSTDLILYKCIVYNTTLSIKTIINILKACLTSRISKKIIVDNKFSNILQDALHKHDTKETDNKLGLC